MKPRILIVDDQPAVRRLLRVMLSSAGFEVTEAEDGARALEVLRGPEAPDACVLDVMMPHVDGWTVLESIRQDPVLVDLPVIMLTAKGQPADRLRGWELGCDAYLPKPFDPPECLQEVHAVMVRSAADRRALRERQLAAARAIATPSPRWAG